MPPTTPKKKTQAANKKAATKAAAPVAEPNGIVDPNQDPYAPTAWGSSEVGGLTDLTVPSGQLCLVRRPGIEGLLKEGVLRDLDSFTALVNKEHVERVKGKKGKPSDRAPKKGKTSEDIGELLKDPNKLANVMHTVDRVICHVVVKPAIQMTPNDPTSRKVGVVYADMVELVDKMFIFNFVVGGSRDIERFLEESNGALGDLDAGQAVERQA